MVNSEFLSTANVHSVISLKFIVTVLVLCSSPSLVAHSSFWNHLGISLSGLYVTTVTVLLLYHLKKPR